MQPNNGLNEPVNNENLPNDNVSDNDMESEVHHRREAEFMGLVDKRNVKAKEWVDNLIITSQSQHILSPHGQCTLSPHGQPIVSPQGQSNNSQPNPIG